MGGNLLPRGHGTYRKDSSPVKTRNCLFYIIYLTDADGVTAQGATASATMIFAMLNRNDAVPVL